MTTRKQQARAVIGIIGAVASTATTDIVQRAGTNSRQHGDASARATGNKIRDAIQQGTANKGNSDSGTNQR